MNINQYFKEIDKEVKRAYVVANLARAKGLDPVNRVEVPIATTLAEKAVGLISTIYPQLLDSGVDKRIMELEAEYGALETAVPFKIAEEIAREKFCKFKDLLEAIDAGIRVGFSYITLGVVSSPLEGFTELKLGKTRDGKEYFKAFFSGPIRSAGTTASCVTLMLIDYLRETFGFAKYDPSEDEVKRYVTENYDYHERVTNLQYLPPPEEIAFLAERLPIQICGEPTERREVSNYKDLDRVESDFIRGGMCLIFSEGLAQKAQKGFRLLKSVKDLGFVATGWDYLDEFIEKFKMVKKTGKGDSKPVYVRDIVAGRPFFGHPSKSGSFRFRYGKCRLNGFSAMSVHPATMSITDGFLSYGTQLKIEKPTKGCALANCDGMDGPIVKLKNGSVRKLEDYVEARKLYSEVSEIIYLGDLLVTFGDVLNRNYEMLKQGYVEEWWALELNKVSEGKENFEGKRGSDVEFDEAVELSNKYGVALYPEYIYYWKEINYELFLGLLDWLARGNVSDGMLILPFSKGDIERFSKGKRALELLGVEHEVGIEHVILKGRALLFNLGVVKEGGVIEEDIDLVIGRIKEIKQGEKEKEGEYVLRIVTELCSLVVKDKSGTFIGARMGRPEKAKLRKLTGSPHVLFPVGEEGGRLRSFQAAFDVGYVKGEFPLFYCNKCKGESVYSLCVSCGEKCGRLNYCRVCDKKGLEPCEEHKDVSVDFEKRKIDIRRYFDNAKKVSGLSLNDLGVVKGVRGTSNKDHSCEHLAKGLIRAKYNLNVNKDGTIRYDMTEMPLTHFRAREIGTSVEKLRELGYEIDINGDKIKSDYQVIELFPHDVLLPACSDSGDEKADDVFLKITHFIDDELERIYGLEKYFGNKSKEDLLGNLIVCMAPHICTATVGRIIGFSKTQGLLASPYMHAAMRRDCLGFGNYVSVKDKSGWRIEKIGEYIESVNPEEKLDEFGTLGRKMNDVATWSNPGEDDVAEVTKHKPSEMIKLFLEDGRNLELTENHKVYVKGKKEKRANELKEGDQLMVSYKRHVEEKDIKEIFLPDIFQNRDDVMLRGVRKYLECFEKMSKHENYCFRDSFPIKLVREILERHGKGLKDLPEEVKIGIKRDNVSLPIRIRLDEKLLEVIGLYIAEGHIRKNDSKKGFFQLSFSGNVEIKNFVKSIFNDYFGLNASYENDESVTFSSRIIYELFKDYLKCGEGAKRKRIPSLFLDLKKKKIAALLRGYYEGDGSVSLSDYRVACDTVSEGLKHDLSFVLSRFGIFTKFYEYETLPGSKVREFYERKNKEIPKTRMTKILVLSNFIEKFRDKIGFLSDRKKGILNELCKNVSRAYGMKIDFDEDYVYPKVRKIERVGEKVSYCFNVGKEHNFFANDLLVHNCDGDEAAAFLLMDMLLNFSRKFLPAHRGGTQDAPLVLNSAIRAGDVDDQILDFEVGKYPLELYEAAEEGLHSSDVKGVEFVKDRLKDGGNPFVGLKFTHDCSDVNGCVLNSSYKSLPTMDEKVEKQMLLCRKIRAVDARDVARLTIERHFIRDTRGNLRKFSMQVFRCVGCNSKYRRPPLTGRCTKCGGKIIFTITEGSIAKYMQRALDLASEFKVEPYLIESLELTEMYIQSIFGKDPEIQENISKWF